MKHLLSIQGKAGVFEWWAVSIASGFLIRFGRIAGAGLWGADKPFGVLAAFGFGALALASLWTLISVTVRRLRDRGHPPRRILIGLIPVVGWLWLLLECGMSESATAPAMTQTKNQPIRTRWGCLSIPIIVTLLIVWGRIQAVRYANQPLEVHLRDVFKQSGFRIPDDATDLTGWKGDVDFHGDYLAGLTFSVRPDQIDAFLHLRSDYWRKPDEFKQLEKKGYCYSFEIPAGTYKIEERFPDDYERIYAVNKTTCRVYFYRGSS